MERVRQSLKPGGRVVLIEYRKEDPSIPIQPLHKMTVREVRDELEPMGQAGERAQRCEDLGYTLTKEQLDSLYKAFTALADRKKHVYDEDIEALVDDEIAVGMGRLGTMFACEQEAVVPGGGDVSRPGGPGLGGSPCPPGRRARPSGPCPGSARGCR